MANWTQLSLLKDRQTVLLAWRDAAPYNSGGGCSGGSGGGGGVSGSDAGEVEAVMVMLVQGYTHLLLHE